MPTANASRAVHGQAVKPHFMWCILADACGLGKTTTAIILLWYASILAERDASHVHKPTLILCPPALVDTWLAELTVRLGDAFTILLLQGSSQHTSDYSRESLTVDTIEDLRSRLGALDDTKCLRTSLNEYDTNSPQPFEIHCQLDTVESSSCKLCSLRCANFTTAAEGMLGNAYDLRRLLKWYVAFFDPDEH